MQLTDLNPEGGIGANCLHLELGPFRIIVDAGMHPKKVGLQSLPDINAVPENSVDLVILTHCHLDHLGALPLMLRRQSLAEVVCTPASQLLVPILLRNSSKVMLRQREELGVKELPLYLSGEADAVQRRLVPTAFDRTRTFEKNGEELHLTLHAAGHVPGAAGIMLQYKHRKIFFTADVLFEDQNILPGARFPGIPVDTLVMETTRGATPKVEGVTRTSETARFVETLDATLAHGGSVLIPVFALGRMQEVLAIIAEARQKRRLRKCPIYTAGLGMDICDAFDEIHRKFGQVRFTRSVVKDLECMRLPRGAGADMSIPEPSIFVVSSGMMVANTPSYGICARLLGDHHNTICFVGYCDPDTPGGQLMKANAGENFFFDALNRMVRIQAQVERINLTGHASREDLVAFAVASQPRTIVLTHGDPEARAWFECELYDAIPGVTVVDPVPGQPILV